MTTRTNGQIIFDTIQAYYAKHAPEGSPLRTHICDWKTCPTELAKAAFEAAGEAMIEEERIRKLPRTGHS